MKRRTWLMAAIAGALGYAGWKYWEKASAPEGEALIKGGKNPSFGQVRRRLRATSVRAVEARLQDVDVYVSALGTVRANQTVEVLCEIQGRLESVLFAEGSFVKKGDVLATVDTSTYRAQLRQYEGSLAESEALLANARKVLARYTTLYKKNSISIQDYEEQQALVKQYEGAVKSARGQVEGAKVSIAYGTVKAPVSGFVGLREVDVGNIVGPSSTTPIATITETSPISVQFSIPQSSLPEVAGKVRSGAGLRVLVFDQNGNSLLAEGVVKAVGNEIDVGTGTVLLKAEFENADSRLFPNQFVNVRLITDIVRQAVVVPASAIQNGTSGRFVFKVDADSIAHKIDIVAGTDAGDGWTSVVSGVSAGDRLITTGIDSATDGGLVSVVGDAAPSAPSAPAGSESVAKTPRP